MEALLSSEEVAALLKLRPRTPYDPRWRQRAGLRSVRVGRLLRFRVVDIQKLIEAGLDPAPNTDEEKRR